MKPCWSRTEEASKQLRSHGASEEESLVPLEKGQNMAVAMA